MPNIKIGHGAVIGTNALVNKDIPPYAIVVGTPAKILKYRFTETQITKLLSIKWWDWPDKKIIDEQPSFFVGIEEFIERHQPARL